MPAKCHLLPAACILALLVVCGCNRKPSDSVAALKAANQSAAAASDPASASTTGAADTNRTNAALTSSDTNQNAGNTSTKAAPAPDSSASTADSSAQATAGNQAAESKASAAAPLILPSGTSVTIRLLQGLSSANAVPGERFEGVLAQPLVSLDHRVIPAGTPVLGHVVAARHSGRLHRPGELALTLDSIVIRRRGVPLFTSKVVARGASHKKRDLAWIGGGAGGGALLGVLAAGARGALIGSGIGAAAGTTTALFTGRKDVAFGNERRLRFRLNRDVAIAT